MKGTKFAVVLLLGVLLIAGIACGGSPAPTPTTTPTVHEVNVNESDSGGQIDLSIGDHLIVTLASNTGSTGYSWNISSISNTSVIAKVSDEYITPTPTDSALVGQPGHEVWTFEALAAGTADISMKYFQSWDPEAEPAANFSITVNVN